MSHFCLFSERFSSPVVELMSFRKITSVILWHQFDSSLDYIYRTLYGAMSSEAQPLTSIMSALTIIAINADYRAHLFCLLQPPVYECYWSFPHPNTVHASTLSSSHSCYIPRPNNSSLFYYPNDIWWGVQIIKFKRLNAELNPICHLLALLGAHHIFHFGQLRVKL